MRRAAIALFLVACTSEPPPSTIELTLGTVDAAGAGFFPLSGDQPLVPGSQGGFHVWLKFRIDGAPPAVYIIRREVRRVSDNALILRALDNPVDLTVPGSLKPGGEFELSDPMPSFMCPTPIGVSVRNEVVRFDVKLLDGETEEVLDEVTAEATPRCPPEGDPQRAFCEAICSG